MVTGMEEHVRAAPAAALRPYLNGYVGYRQRDVPPAVHRGLPYFAASDPEGNRWSFGTYPGEPRKSG
jgi:hypothetical protein